MPIAHIVRDCAVLRTARIQQLEGLFELPHSKRSGVEFTVELRTDERPWNIGLIVGPSGSGKTTILRQIYESILVSNLTWPERKSILDGFPPDMGIKEITALLSSVGFSSPPAWLRPYPLLSNGEQFRVTLARAIAENEKGFALDEYTSVVDRTVAKIGSTALARTVRKRKTQVVLASCHYDIVDWLQPDWIYQPHTNEFHWRSVRRRPDIALTIQRVDSDAWQLFRQHHYLDTKLNPSAALYLATLTDTTPAACCAVLPFPHPRRPGWRLHRLVTLPDYQGVGIGVALSDFVSACYKATGRPVFRTASHPAVISHCARSLKWRMRRKPSLTRLHSHAGLSKTTAHRRLTAGFEFVGPVLRDEALGFGLLQGRKVRHE